MKNFILIFFLFSNLSFANAQSVSGNALNNFVVAKSDTANFKVITDSLMNVLPNKSIYIIGETHANKANKFIFYPLFKELHKSIGVNYILMEMHHSLYFGYNLFLKFGDVRILAEFNKVSEKDSLKLRSSFTNALALYEYNEKQPIGNKIEFIGVDLDLSNIVGFRVLTQHHYITAIKYFKKYSIQSLPTPLNEIFDDIINAEVNDLRFLLEKDKELQKLSVVYREELKACLGDFYKDFYIIVNSAKSFPNGRRDPVMVNNLDNAYRVIKEHKPNSEPKFFGSFGAAHVIPGNNGSFASKMNSSFIIKGGVAFIGASYFNSTTNYSKTVREIDKSSLGGLSNKDEHLANTVLKDVSAQQKSPIVLLGRFNKIQNKELNFFKGFDAVFVFTGF
jgi:hypothetical protein